MRLQYLYKKNFGIIQNNFGCSKEVFIFTTVN